MGGLAKDISKTFDREKDEDAHPIEDIVHDRHCKSDLELFWIPNMQKSDKSRGKACPNIGTHNNRNCLLHSDASRSDQGNHKGGDSRGGLYDSSAKGADEESNGWIGEVFLG